MKILVTGGTGAVGRFVCRELVACGQEPVIASRHTPTESPEAVEWVEWDMARESALDVSEFNTSSMIFGVAEYISAISEYITLRPGDVIWTGTDKLLIESCRVTSSKYL